MWFEVLRWVSIVCLWLCIGLDIYAMIRCHRSFKKLESERSILLKTMAKYDGKPPVVYCCECDSYEKAKVNEKGFLICPASGMDITAHDYCSYATTEEASGGKERQL